MSWPRPRLQSLIFEVTQRCNHACLHCYNVWQGEDSPHPPYPRGELDTSQTLALIAKALDEVDCHHVTLTGGEPLLRRDLPELLTFLKTRQVQTTVISNGRLLDEPTVVKLLECGAGLFELPLLSHQRATHDQLSGAPGAWDAVLAGMANLRLHRGQFAVAFVATRLNIEHLYPTLRLASAFGARAVMFNRFNPGGRGRQNLDLLLPNPEQVRQALQTANAAAAELRLPIACSIPIQPCLVDTRPYTNLGFGYCAAGGERAYYTLDPLGNLRPCNHSDLILGSLLEERFAELTAPARMQAFTQAIPAYCAGCERRTQCQGGCKAAAQVCYGALDAEEPFLRLRPKN
ncbi:MAG TPA: radical SAM protein [Anaerolineales bacterium]|nr:radical SAM protein [Anaerolineales bacterium]